MTVTAFSILLLSIKAGVKKKMQSITKSILSSGMDFWYCSITVV